MISKFYGKADGYLEALLVKFLILENPVAVPDSLSSKKTQRLGQKSNDKVKKKQKEKKTQNRRVEKGRKNVQIPPD